MSGLGYIAPEPETKCELCGKIEECRPYGPRGEQICFECGMKDEKKTTERQFRRIVLGENIQ